MHMLVARHATESLQIFYTCSSFYIIFLMTSVYARTREREKAWKFGMYCLLAPIVITPFWYWLFHETAIGKDGFLKVGWARYHQIIGTDG